MKGILNENLRLLDLTTACGPEIFNSHSFGNEYYDNAIVAEPAANLIKRDILSFNSDSDKGREACKSKEFLESNDEPSRPVNL